MNIETIDKRITELQQEQSDLVSSHDRTVQQYQQMIATNQARFQQLKGAIDILSDLKVQLNGST